MMEVVKKMKTEFERGQEAAEDDVDPLELYSLPSLEYLTGYHSERCSDHKLGLILASVHRECSPADCLKVLTAFRDLPLEAIDALYMAMATDNRDNDAA